jgi:acetyl-CoA carboxylase/biotin carboxylase 1
MEDYVKDRGGNLPIRKVLIASNGMGATKSILSMRRWAYMELGDEGAIHFVAMATPEDIKANAEFVRLADSYVEVPGGVNRNNYANVTVITQVAKDQGESSTVFAWTARVDFSKHHTTTDLFFPRATTPQELTRYGLAGAMPQRIPSFLLRSMRTESSLLGPRLPS